MKRNVLLILAAVSCLAFDTKDDPPPPPPVGHTIYCLSYDEVVDAVKLWLEKNKLPITGKVTIDTTTYTLYNTTSFSSSRCTPTPSPSKEEEYLKIKVEYQKK